MFLDVAQFIVDRLQYKFGKSNILLRLYPDKHCHHLGHILMEIWYRLNKNYVFGDDVWHTHVPCNLMFVSGLCRLSAWTVIKVAAVSGSTWFWLVVQEVQWQIQTCPPKFWTSLVGIMSNVRSSFFGLEQMWGAVMDGIWSKLEVKIKVWNWIISVCKAAYWMLKVIQCVLVAWYLSLNKSNHIPSGH